MEIADAYFDFILGTTPPLVVVAIPILSWGELNRRPPDPRIATHSLVPPYSRGSSFSSSNSFSIVTTAVSLSRTNQYQI